MRGTLLSFTTGALIALSSLACKVLFIGARRIEDLTAWGQVYGVTPRHICELFDRALAIYVLNELVTDGLLWAVCGGVSFMAIAASIDVGNRKFETKGWWIRTRYIVPRCMLVIMTVLISPLVCVVLMDIGRTVFLYHEPFYLKDLAIMFPYMLQSCYQWCLPVGLMLGAWLAGEFVLVYDKRALSVPKT